MHSRGKMPGFHFFSLEDNDTYKRNVIILQADVECEITVPLLTLLISIYENSKFAPHHCLKNSHRVAVFFCEMIFARSFADASCFANGIVKFRMEKSWFVPLPTGPHLQTEENRGLTVAEISLEREWLLLFLSCFNIERFIDFQIKGNICVWLFLFVRQ